MRVRNKKIQRKKGEGEIERNREQSHKGHYQRISEEKGREMGGHAPGDSFPIVDLMTSVVFPPPKFKLAKRSFRPPSAPVVMVVFLRPTIVGRGEHGAPLGVNMESLWGEH